MKFSAFFALGLSLLFSSLSANAAPLNDQQFAAEFISVNVATVQGSNVEASKDLGELNHAGNVGGASVWWLWTPPQNTRVTISTLGSSFDTVLAVYADFGGLFNAASSDDAGGTLQSTVTFTTFGVSGVNYYIAVDGYNGGGGAAVGEIQLSIATVPAVTLTAPANGAVFTSPTNLALTATASSPNGTISRVEFYEGLNRLGTDPSAPYSVIWTNPAPGSYVVSALAVDNAGLSSVSGSAAITVNPPGFIRVSLLSTGSVWRYLDTGTNLGTSWVEAGFDDSGWLSGPGPLGYGDTHIRTPVASGAAPNFFITTYFRRTLVVTNAGSLSQLLFRLLRDDGAAVFVNGSEVFRSNLPEGALNYLTTAPTAISGSGETNYSIFNLNPGVLVEGTNVLAVELHQQSSTSTDLGFDLEIVGGISSGVRVTSPFHGAIYNTPASIPLTASAVLLAGTVASIEYFADGVSLGSATMAPYHVTWAEAPPGMHALTAVATDSLGGRMTSSVVNITVAAPLAPTILAVSPPPGPLSNLTSITVTFSEPVAGVNASDLLVEGKPAFKVVSQGLTHFIFAVNQPQAGLSTVSWAPGHGISDLSIPPLAFDEAAPNATWDYDIVDVVSPVLLTRRPQPETTVSSLTRAEVTFSEPVSGVGAADLLINGVPATGVSGAGASYTFTFPQPGLGFVFLSWAFDAGIHDLSSRQNPFDVAAPGASWYVNLELPRTFLVGANEFWRLRRGTNEASIPAPAWRENGFNDGAWEELPAVFYFGETWPVGTLLNDMLNRYTTIYLRRSFNVTNLALLSDLRLRAQCDDGFIAWINGVEVIRYNVPEGEQPFNASASGAVSESTVPPSVPFILFLQTDPAAYLLPGTNVLAVHVFNAGLNSSDLVFDLELSALVSDPAVVPPALAVIDPAPGNLNALTNITLQFSETVSGVDAADLLINGEPATGVNGAGATYTFTFPQPPFGTVFVSWAVDPGIVDFDSPPQLFNSSAPGASFAYSLINADAPVITAQNPAANALVSRLTQIEITWSETVTSVDAADLLVNGVPATGVSGAGAMRLFTFPQPEFGTVSIGFVADAGITDTETPPNLFDPAGEGAFWLCTLRDLLPPVVVAQMPAAGAELTNLTQVTVSFSEPVTGVDAGDFLINGTPATGLASDGSNYVFTFPQPSAAIVRVSWTPLHGIADLAPVPNPFNAAALSSTWQYRLIDVIPPLATGISPTPGATLRELTRVEVTFSEAVSGVDAGDLLVNGQPAETVRGSLRGPYEFEFNSPAAGLVTLQWAASGGMHDYASPSNRLAGGSWSYTFNPALPAPRVVINEIMYHPISVNRAEEYLEFYNAGTGAVNLAGWRLDAGVDFTFPSYTLPARGYLVVAADVSTFTNLYPGVTNVLGNWAGSLGNSGERIELEDAAGDRVDEVIYADEGDWAVRVRGPFDQGYYGWDWLTAHDGLGSSLELCNPALPNEHGQNWKPSLTFGGTPGWTNSVFTNNVAPLIVDVGHFPIVPRSTNNVAVTARVLDEDTDDRVVRLFFRNHSQNTPGAFASTNMFDEGRHGDGGVRDGVFGAILPPFADRAVIEFYVQAVDVTGRTNTWPAPARQLDETFAQTANALYQVDNTVYTGAYPVHRLILTESERIEFQNINRQSDAEMNCTFITTDGTDTKLRHLCGVRIRGAGSRGAAVPNNRVNIPRDRPWNGLTELNQNAQYGFNQVLGAALARKAGLPGANARTIQVRINGQNLASGGSPQYGNYALLEPFNSEWADQHRPGDSEGNIYRASTGNHSANFNDRGANPQSYINAGFAKVSNTSENDWSDLIRLCDVMSNTPDASYAQAVRNVVNVELWMRYFAFFSLTVSRETSLGNGRGDDYALYRGVADPRFIALAHDLDTIFNQGDTAGATNTPLFRMIVQAPGHTVPNVAQLNRFMRHPEFAPLYFRELKQQVETVFASAQFNPLIDQLLGPEIPVINAMKTFNRDRASWVLAQIPLQLTIAGAPASGGFLTNTSGAISLSGQANVIETRTVLVGGQAVSWVPADGLWSAPNLNLLPGLNRVLVQALDAAGVEIARRTVDVWYDTGATTDVGGVFSGDTLWPAAAGPYRVSSSVTVPAGSTLTIQPGATVYFNQGAALNVNGRLLAEGTDTQRIRFTRQPGTTATWGGLRLTGSQENRIAYADIEFASTGDPITAQNSVLFVDHVSFSGTTRTIIDLVNASAIIRNSVFPTIADNETIHGDGMPPAGYVIIESNYFGGTTGYSDIIDFTGGQRPGPILQVLNNVFDGGSDDVLDLDGTDAHIEGNIFRHVHQDAVRDSGSHGVATDAGSEVVVVRNLFEDVDHALLLKNGASAIFSHNTVVGVRTNAASASLAAVINFGEPNRGVGGAAGAVLEGNIFWDVDADRHFLNFTNGVMFLSVNRSLLAGTNHPGLGNLSADPLFVDAAGDFHLRADSPARGTGPNGLDMGAFVPAGATITGEPEAITPSAGAALTIGGPGIVSYRFRVNDGAYSSDLAVTNPITLAGLSNGSYTVFVLGRNSAGVEQPAPTVSATWTVNPSLARLVINEVLARNASAVNVDGAFPDLVELHNAGGLALNLAGFRLTDDPADPDKFIFPPGTTLAPGEFLVLAADSLNPPGLHLGFGLNAEGDELLLFDRRAAGGYLLDRVAWGPQLADLSIGRLPGDQWSLTRPTLGAANTAAPLGDIYRLRLNEWLAAGDSPFPDDFLELYNPGPMPVALGGLYLSDEPVGLPARHRIAPLSYIAPGGFTVFTADSDENAGPTHLNFSLASEQGALSLADTNLAFIDFVLYGPQTNDVSRGRSPNGGTNLVFFLTPTPGAPNPGPVLTNLPVVINEVFANNVSYLETDGSAPDWIELFNPSANIANLADLSLTDTPGTPRRYVFPAGTMLAPGERLVLRCDSNLPASADNTGFGLNRGGSGLYLFDRPAEGGSLLNSVIFGIQAVDFSIGRLPDGTGTWALALPTRGAPNASAALGNATNLKVNEWMANPASGDDWFELYNPESQPVALGGLRLTDNLTGSPKYTIPALSYLGVGLHGYQRFEADNKPAAGADHVNFALSASGESLGLATAAGAFINSVSFGAQAEGVSQGRLPDGQAAIVSFSSTPTPGEANYLPLTNVVINEVLTHTDLPFEDAIELFNAGTAAVNVGGWFLSDTRNHLKKFRLPDGTSLAPGAFTVIYEGDFNPLPGDPQSFSLNSARGDEVWLSAATTNGTLTGHRAQVKFGAAENGASFGRHRTSVGVEFTALSQRTFGEDEPQNVIQFRLGEGLPNSGPRLSSIVISEIMYHPPDLDGADNARDEFIELRNLTALPVALHDPLRPTNTWRLRDAVDYEFPAGVLVPANGAVLVVNFDPAADPVQLAAFRQRQGVPPTVAAFGPFRGKLDNSGEPVELLKPDAPQVAPDPDAGLVPYVLMDRVAYADRAPWPTQPDGSGASLQKLHLAGYGNEPTNWVAGSPTAGALYETNLAPVLDPLADRVVPEGTRLNFNLTADDPNEAPQKLTFTLATGAPTNAVLTADGRFRWTPLEAQGPGVYDLTFRVTDDGVPALSASRTVRFTVTEVNQPPQPLDLRRRYAHPGTPVTFATAADRDIPAQTVAFAPAGALPPGAQLHAVTGLFSWTAGSPGVYPIMVQATDNGVPPATQEITYVVEVVEPTFILIVSELLPDGGNFLLRWQATPGRTYRVLSRASFSDPAWVPWGEDIVAAGSTITLPVPKGAGGVFRIQQMD